MMVVARSDEIYDALKSASGNYGEISEKSGGGLPKLIRAEPKSQRGRVV
jgi:hypothetical protein